MLSQSLLGSWKSVPSLARKRDCSFPGSRVTSLYARKGIAESSILYGGTLKEVKAKIGCARGQSDPGAEMDTMLTIWVTPRASLVK